MTWPFVIAPIVAAESFLAGNGHALATEDADDRAADHGKGQPDAPSDHDQTIAGAVHTPDESRDDQTDSPRLLGVVPKALHNGDLQHEAHVKPQVVHDALATPSPGGDGSGGGGGGGSTDSGDTNTGDANASPDSGITGNGSSSPLTGTSFGSPTETSPTQSIGGVSGLAHTATDALSALTGSVTSDVLVPVTQTASGALSTLTSSVGDVLTPVTHMATDAVSALTSSVADVLAPVAHTVPDAVSALTGSVADVLAPVTQTATDAVSALTGSVADVVAPVGLSSSADLKNLLGFDLQVNSDGKFIATDLGTEIDQNPSHATANTLSNAVSHVADNSPVVNFGTSNPLDSLFGINNHSVVGHLGDLTSLASNGDIGSSDTTSSLDDTTSALKGSLTSNGTASLEKVADASPTASPDGSLNSLLPVTGAVSDSAHASIVGEASPVTPGHSIDFPAPAPPEGDVLFGGNNYTDYHVALQATGPSVASNSIATALPSVTSTPDTTSLAHVDTTTVNHTAPSPTAQHQDSALAHIATALDELTVRAHTL